MNVDGWKIKKLIEFYGAENGYDVKSYLPKFCEENKLNYIQWNAYTRGTQTLGIKIVYLLIDIFPNINLNWLLKDEPNMFVGDKTETIAVKEPETKYQKEIGPEDIYNKMEEMLSELKALNKKKV